jgi:enoyl-CoA hydratase/carnithine racemase
MTDDKVRLDIDGPIATITNDNPDKRNAFTDAMDQRLFEILGELRDRPDVRAVIWRGEGHSFSSGRDVSAIGVQICGPGVVSDLVLTGRPMDAAEALTHGIVSRVVPRDELDATVRDMAERIAAAPAMTAKLARQVISHLAEPEIRSSMADELMMQTLVNTSHDYAEFRAARAEGRDPTYTGT